MRLSRYYLSPGEPLIITKPPQTSPNDQAPTIINLRTITSFPHTARWLCHYLPGDLLYKAFEASSLVRAAFMVVFEVMRTNVIILWLGRAHEVIPPSKYYAIPIWGPILSGWAAGCFGGFIVGGLAVIEKEVSWMVQSALYATLFYHLAVYDPSASPLLKAQILPTGTAAEWKTSVHLLTV